MTNFKSWQSRGNQIFNPNAFYLPLRDATWYYNATYILFTNFASFIGYEDKILEGISNFTFQEPNLAEKKDKFGGKSFKKLNSAEFTEFVFFKSGKTMRSFFGWQERWE